MFCSLLLSSLFVWPFYVLTIKQLRTTAKRTNKTDDREDGGEIIIVRPFSPFSTFSGKTSELGANRHERGKGVKRPDTPLRHVRVAPAAEMRFKLCFLR